MTWKAKWRNNIMGHEPAKKMKVHVHQEPCKGTQLKGPYNVWKRCPKAVSKVWTGTTFCVISKMVVSIHAITGKDFRRYGWNFDEQPFWRDNLSADPLVVSIDVCDNRQLDNLFNGNLRAVWKNHPFSDSDEPWSRFNYAHRAINPKFLVKRAPQ